MGDTPTHPVLFLGMLCLCFVLFAFFSTLATVAMSPPNQEASVPRQCNFLIFGQFVVLTSFVTNKILINSSAFTLGLDNYRGWQSTWFGVLPGWGWGIRSHLIGKAETGQTCAAGMGVGESGSTQGQFLGPVYIRRWAP